jgi:hypothetical protein
MQGLRRAAAGIATVLLASLHAGALGAAEQLRIVTPAPDETVHSNAGVVPVVVTGAPRGARLQPLLGGEPAGEPQSAAAFELHGVPRGTHRLQVLVLDERGQPVARSEPVEFHVWQASRLFRTPAAP